MRNLNGGKINTFLEGTPISVRWHTNFDGLQEQHIETITTTFRKWFAKVANKQLMFFFARVSLFQKILYPLTVTKILKQNESVGTPPLTASHQRCSCTIFKLPDYTTASR